LGKSQRAQKKNSTFFLGERHRSGPSREKECGVFLFGAKTNTLWEKKKKFYTGPIVIVKKAGVTNERKLSLELRGEKRRRKKKYPPGNQIPAPYGKEGEAFKRFAELMEGR